MRFGFHVTPASDAATVTGIRDGQLDGFTVAWESSWILVGCRWVVDSEGIVVVNNDISVRCEAHRNLTALVALVEIISYGESVRPN